MLLPRPSSPASHAAIAIASGNAAGKSSPWPFPSLPAAQQTTQPWATAAFSALWIALLGDTVPRLRLITAALAAGSVPDTLERCAA
jgi:hypothetical protein